MITTRISGITFLFLMVCSSAGFGAEVKSLPLHVPFMEQFAAPQLDSAWTVHAAKGNTVAVKDGEMEIRARENSRAHIERALNADLIRVSCTIRPAEVAATSSVFVCWDKSNHCQIGVFRGHIRVREVLGTYAYDYELGIWPAGQRRSVAIEVATGCIRYFAGKEGGEFQCIRVAPRPERLAGVPTLLMIGDGAETKVFPRPDPFIDPAPSEAFGTSWVRDLRVTKLDATRAQASREELAALAIDGRDALGEQELAGKDDPTFESVCRHFPPLKWPREAIGVKDHPHAIGVAHDGGLQFTDNSAKRTEPTGFFQIGEPLQPQQKGTGTSRDGILDNAGGDQPGARPLLPYRFGTGHKPCARKLLNGYLPVVILIDRHDGLELEQTAFGDSKNFLPEEPLFAWVRLKITNTSDAARQIKLQWRVEPASEQSPPLSWEFELPARGSRGVDLRAPFTILQSRASAITSGEFDRRLAEVVAYWDGLLAPGSRFEIPERRVQDAYRAWLAYNFINVHKRGDVYHVCDGSGFYDRVYGYSAALYCINMDLLGYHDLAERYLDSLLTFMKPNGLLEVNFGSTDTGAALYAMSEHYRITKDAAWLRRVAPKMLALSGWIIERRKQTLAGAASQPAVARGLIRHKPYADLLHPAADYFSNSYLCRGMAAAASVLAEIGMREEAARLKQESDTYLTDITTSMAAAVFKDGDMDILPAIPDTHELWKESNGSSNGYYSLVAGCMLESGIPAWNDPKADLLINALRRRGGLVLGVSRFHDLIDHAYAYGYWMTCLRRDDVKSAILGLYGSMAYGMTRETYSAVECHAIRSGENYWTLPHTYSNTQQLRILRHMLLREEGEDLLLAYAVPRPWLAAGRRIAVKAAPSLFGPASFSIEADADAIKVHVDPPTRSPVRMVRVRLRRPSQENIQAVEVEPKVDVRFEGDVIELPGLNRPVELRVR